MNYQVIALYTVWPKVKARLVQAERGDNSKKFHEKINNILIKV